MLQSETAAATTAPFRCIIPHVPNVALKKEEEEGGGMGGMCGGTEESMESKGGDTIACSTDVVGSNSLESLPPLFRAVSSIPTRKYQEEREYSLF